MTSSSVKMTSSDSEMNFSMRRRSVKTQKKWKFGLKSEFPNWSTETQSFVSTATREGHVESLKLMNKLEDHFDPRYMFGAAKNGHIHMLNFIRERMPDFLVKKRLITRQFFGPRWIFLAVKFLTYSNGLTKDWKTSSFFQLYIWHYHVLREWNEKRNVSILKRYTSSYILRWDICYRTVTNSETKFQETNI